VTVEPLPVGAHGDTVALIATVLERISRDVDGIDMETAFGMTATAVHGARVAVRRARADLRMLRPMLDPLWVDERRAELQPLGERLAEVRHIDTMLAYLERAADEKRSCAPDAWAFARALFSAREIAVDQARWVAKSAAVAAARRALHHAAIAAPVRPGCARLFEAPEDLAIMLVGRPRRMLRRAALRVGRDGEPALDDLRIAARHLRYAADAVAAVAPDAEVVAGSASVLHQALGDIADGQLVQRFLDDPPAGVQAGLALRKVLRGIIDDDVAIAERAWPFALELALEAPVRAVREVTPIRAAGGVVWRQGEHGIEVLVVHRPKYDDWSLPKGQLLPHEAPAVGAVREVAEETGIACRVTGELGGVTYSNRHGRAKHVAYFVMEPVNATQRSGREVDDIQWLPWREARRVVRKGRDRRLITALVTSADIDLRCATAVRAG